MKKLTPRLSILLLLIVTACNLPQTAAETPTPTLSVDEIYLTLQAQLALTAGTPTPVPPSATLQPQPTSQPSALPSATIPPASATPVCNRAAAGNPIDVSVPDGTLMQPGQTFTKTWRLVNTGTCTWTTSYAVVWFSGTQFNAPLKTNLLGPVAPGQTVEVSLAMKAPDAAGSYQGYFQLQDPSGVQFGLGGQGPFWVLINVAGAGTVTATPSVPIVASGPAQLAVGDGFDLDNFTVTGGEGADIFYLLESSSSLVLSPGPGVLIGVFGLATPGYGDCRTAPLNNTPINVLSTPLNTYLCYRTGQGLYGRLMLSALDPDYTPLTIEILTWGTQ